MRNKKSFKVFGIVFACIFLLVFIFYLIIVVYSKDYYKAEQDAYKYIENPASGINVLYKDKYVAFVPENPMAGVVIYPGALVQFEAYAPLAEKLAENGILATVVDMPRNLAIFDGDAAEKVIGHHPEVPKWYVAGHSLGGSVASVYVSKNVDKYEGIIFLASYSASELDSEAVDILSIYGTNDGVLAHEKYEEAKDSKMPDTTEVVIDGGTHAFFGYYGEQDGDGEPTISREEQIDISVEAIKEFVERD